MIVPPCPSSKYLLCSERRDALLHCLCDRIGQDASLWYNEDESRGAGPRPLHTLHATLTDGLPDRAARFERLCESRWPISPFTCWGRCK
jgi:hypothetical protein